MFALATWHNSFDADAYHFLHCIINRVQESSYKELRTLIIITIMTLRIQSAACRLVAPRELFRLLTAPALRRARSPSTSRALSISISSRAAGDGDNANEEGASHFRRSSVKHPLADQLAPLPPEEKQPYTLPHPIWSQEELEGVTISHEKPETKVDHLAYYAVRSLRVFFDVGSGYSWGKLTGTLDERKWLTRIIFLETVAGVPGMIAAMTRHLSSLRHLRRDHGWIHTLLEEAENERMHLLTALTLRNPGRLFRAAIVASQGVFVSMFWLAYFISPRFCHRFVGYLEEEAVKTYTLCLECLDRGELPMWAQLPAPPIASKYWKLPDGAMMRDVILVIRADEAHHRLVNHTLSSIQPHDHNPYKPGQ